MTRRLLSILYGKMMQPIAHELESQILDLNYQKADWKSKGKELHYIRHSTA